MRACWVHSSVRGLRCSRAGVVSVRPIMDAVSGTSSAHTFRRWCMPEQHVAQNRTSSATAVSPTCIPDLALRVNRRNDRISAAKLVAVRCKETRRGTQVQPPRSEGPMSALSLRPSPASVLVGGPRTRALGATSNGGVLCEFSTSSNGTTVAKGVDGAPVAEAEVAEVALPTKEEPRHSHIEMPTITEHLPWAITHTTTAAVCGETLRMENPNNMNVQAEQNAAASTSAPSTTASTAAAQAPQQIASCFGPAHTCSTQEAPTPAPADLIAARAGTATGANMTASASPWQQPVALVLSAARMSIAADESTHTSQASQLVVDVVDQEPSTSVGTEERSKPAAGGAPVANDAASGDVMFPGETEWGDGLGGVLFGTPAQNKGKRKKGQLELEPPNFPIPELGGGSQRKRYPLKFMVDAVRYSQRKIKGAQGPNVTVGITYATRILKIPDNATLAAWVKNVAKYEAALAEADTFKGGGTSEKNADIRLSLNVGRIRTHAAAERGVVDWINELRSDGISARVSTKTIKTEAVDSIRTLSGRGRRHPNSRAPSSARTGRTSGAEGFSESTASLCELSPGKARNFLSGWPVVATLAIKEWRRLKYDVPSALELADGVECLGVVAGAGGSASGSGGGSGACVLSGPRLKFAVAQIDNMGETPTWFESPGKDTVNATGEKEIAVKAGGEEKMRITSVLTVFADGSKLPPLLIFKSQLSPKGKSPAANSIEREFKNYKDRKGCAYPRGMAYAVDPKGWHSQRLFDDVWVPQVWNRRPGWQGRLGGYRQPDTPLAWDDYTVHKTDASTKAMEESNTTLFPIPGGLTPISSRAMAWSSRSSRQTCPGSTTTTWLPRTSRATTAATRIPLRGAFDGSEDEAWAYKKLGSNAKGEPIGAPSDAADKADSSSRGENLLEVLYIGDDDDAGVVVVDVSDDEGEEL
ncbi:unnamed protein product [Ectocarpus sp. CCAP 1310/34]|nr:unnamed protein product [Ectocarpus sp. CCAP 1310/34]